MGTHEIPASWDRRSPPCWYRTGRRKPCPSSSPPCRREWGVVSGSSLLRRVLGSTRPSTLAMWPVYQSEPSPPAKGSCGRERGVGTCHALIETVVGPGITTPAGFPFSGKFLVKYFVIVAT